MMAANSLTLFLEVSFGTIICPARLPNPYFWEIRKFYRSTFSIRGLNLSKLITDINLPVNKIQAQLNAMTNCRPGPIIQQFSQKLHGHTVLIACNS